MKRVFLYLTVIVCCASACKSGGSESSSTESAGKKGSNAEAGMVWIPEAGDKAGFWMDETEVTNKQFALFVKETNYLTTAERAPIWEELKMQLPAGTPKPHDSVLVAASLVFSAPNKPVNLNDPGSWWVWSKGANWKHPEGPKSSLDSMENFPVVHVSWDDALAYCKWAGKRLPTAEEWERAAHGGNETSKYPWGDEDIDKDSVKANTWQGDFPYTNTNRDGFYRAAPVASFAANGYGLYDLAGNVWEWCADEDRGQKVVKGGSFLCNASYCEGYRIDSKMSSSADTGLGHTGFRGVK